MKTLMAKKETVTREWLLVDAAGLPLGRVASQVASILRGKHKPIYTPHVDTGDYVIVINTDKMILTGNKGVQKKFYRYSGFPGGLKEFDYKTLMASKLKVYKGSEHPHEAQKPRQISIKGDVK